MEDIDELEMLEAESQSFFPFIFGAGEVRGCTVVAQILKVTLGVVHFSLFSRASPSRVPVWLGIVARFVLFLE